MSSHQDAVAALAKDEQFYSAIGRFIFEFSQLEFFLKIVIGDAAQVSAIHFDQIMSHDFAMLCTIGQKVLSREFDKDNNAKLDTMIRRCRELNNHRVRIVHGLWKIDSKSGALEHVSRQKLVVTKHYVNPVELADLADQANSCVNDVMWFYS
jgi:hypothetical protein